MTTQEATDLPYRAAVRITDTGRRTFVVHVFPTGKWISVDDGGGYEIVPAAFLERDTDAQ